MRHPGAIRTHLGRKRVGSRARDERPRQDERADPAKTFRTGDITGSGILTCTGCGWKIRLAGTTVLPPCPQCSGTAFRKEA